MVVRRPVVGDQAVEQGFEKSDEFNMPMQGLMTEFRWGAVWSRPDLDRRSRSILSLGMLVARNRPAELAGNIRCALNNGVTKAEIRRWPP